MSAARDELTGDERAELHRLRRIVKQLRSLLGAPETAPVDERPEAPVAQDREPRSEDFERAAKLRRRKGLANG